MSGIALIVALGVLIGVAIGIRLGFVRRSPDPGTGPVAAELARMRELVQRLETDRARQLGRLDAALAHQHDGVRALLQTTQHLREALASTKTRGQWGERLAEDVLRLSGFVENVNYRKQHAVQGGGIPDYTFLLPNGLVLHMDVKFPLDNYLRSIEASTDVERQRYRAAFVRDVRGHVKQLAARGYGDGEASALDFVLLFIPNEQLYAFIHETDGDLLDDALRRGVVLCSPLTLFAVLALVRQMIDNLRLARTSDEILDLLGQFVDQWDRFCDQMATVARKLESLNKDYEALVGTRTRRLERPLREIERLRTSRAPGAEAFMLDG